MKLKLKDFNSKDEVWSLNIVWSGGNSSFGDNDDDGDDENKIFEKNDWCLLLYFIVTMFIFCI